MLHYVERMSENTEKCETCGAAVIDMDSHEKWHADEPTRIQSKIDGMINRIF